MTLPTVESLHRAEQGRDAARSFYKTMESRNPTAGMVAKVCRGRKIPKGTEGKLLGWGSNEYGEWVRLDINGETVFTAMRNVCFPSLMEAIDAASNSLASHENVYHDALVAAQGVIDLNRPIATHKTEQHAYSDTGCCDYAVPEDASNELIQACLNMLDPRGSSWGALRWSGGSSLKERVSPTVARVNHYTCLCD